MKNGIIHDFGLSHFWFFGLRIILNGIIIILKKKRWLTVIVTNNKISYMVDFYHALLLHRSTPSRDGINSDFLYDSGNRWKFRFFLQCTFCATMKLTNWDCFPQISDHWGHMILYVRLFKCIQDTDSFLFAQNFIEYFEKTLLHRKSATTTKYRGKRWLNMPVWI